MADCNACPDYLSPEDLIRRSVLCSDGKVAALGALLNPYTDEYNAVLTAMTVKPSNADKVLQNEIIVKLKEKGYWDKIALFYNFSLGYGSQLVNWKNPAKYIPTEVGVNMVFRDYVGYRSTGAGGVLKTGLILSENTEDITNESISALIGVGTNSLNSSPDFGVWDNSARFSINAGISNQVDWKCLGLYGRQIANANAIAHYGITRTNAINFRTIKNKVSGNSTQDTSALPTLEMYVCGNNNNGTAVGCGRFVRYLIISQYLTEAELYDIEDIIEAYLLNYKSNLVSTPDYISKSYPLTKQLLSLATYDGANMTIHPSVVDTGEAGWNGYRYWMCNTPLNNTNGSDVENPSLWGSDDGVTWVVPAGITNPVIPKPIGNFNADPDLYFEGSTMYMVYKLHPNCMLCKSTDAVNWSTPLLIKTPDADATEVRSPALLKGIDDRYYIYYTPSGSGKKVRRISADSLEGTWGNVEEIKINGHGNDSTDWHLDVYLHNGAYYLAAGYSTGVYIYKSTDGINFFSAVQPVLNWYEFATAYSESYYRPSIAFINGQATLYYSAIRTISLVTNRDTFKIDIDLL